MRKLAGIIATHDNNEFRKYSLLSMFELWLDEKLRLERPIKRRHYIHYEKHKLDRKKYADVSEASLPNIIY